MGGEGTYCHNAADFRMKLIACATLVFWVTVHQRRGDLPMLNFSTQNVLSTRLTTPRTRPEQRIMSLALHGKSLQLSRIWLGLCSRHTT
jgi:hypothetical protein